MARMKQSLPANAPEAINKILEPTAKPIETQPLSSGANEMSQKNDSLATNGKPNANTADAAKASNGKPSTQAKGKASIKPEVAELVDELRDTVKRLDPRKHTPNSLRRALATVSGILEDIKLQDGEEKGDRNGDGLETK
ncbi:MAG: hypothetical protein DM484_18915 [Candidatus Methylumidiphilus alinenensis]|uniref:Uncharacterized protein n=1 Tax=Candidatus Methylumidiphilus alinenensis TaxID=2202197 RepID=A0A2W4QWC8_9GAMM|nr:MAG: hypothetical protein DM484_18915 [Candidatus Methylumidiphilus alinenensis]